MQNSKEKEYSIGEEVFSSISHGIGTGLSIAGLVLLVVNALLNSPSNLTQIYVIGSVIFGVSMICFYLFSTLYHALTPFGVKKIFSIFDHCSVFILIAGTYTPFCISILHGTYGWILFGINWGLAILGIIFYSIFGHKMKIPAAIMYVIMGWLFLIALKQVKALFPKESIAFLFSGGASYMFGIIFYSLKKFKWTHCIWHVFVLFGTILHYFAVYYII